MRTNNKLAKFVILVLLLTMISLIVLSGTYAKYTTIVTGTDTATVAKWSVKLNDADVTTQTEITTFDLFKSTGIYDLAGVADKDKLSAEIGKIDLDVAEGAKIAPGTWGKVEFKVENESEVAADYSVLINKLETILPLEFSTDGENWVTAGEITTPYSLGGNRLEIDSEAEKVTLYWKWDFESGADELETEIGADGVATCSITAGVTFTQVN